MLASAEAVVEVEAAAPPAFCLRLPSFGARAQCTEGYPACYFELFLCIWRTCLFMACS